MAEHTYRVIDLVGTSPEGIDQAIQNALERANQTIRNLDWFQVSEIRGHMENGTIAHYQVGIKVGFRVEDPADLHRE